MTWVNWMSRVNAIGYLRWNHPDLEKRMRRADERTLMSIATALEAAKRNGHSANDAAVYLTEGLKTRNLRQDSLRSLAAPLEKTAVAGFSPALLARTVLTGLRSKALTPKSLPKSAETIRRIYEAAERIPKGRDYLTITDVSLPIHARLASKTLTHESLELIAPYLEAFAKKGHNPYFLIETLSEGLNSKAITPESLPKAVKTLKGVYDAAARPKKYPGQFAYAFAAGIESKGITMDSVPHYTKLLKTMPRKWEPIDVIRHATDAHKMGVPADSIPGYLMEFAKRKHFPNAGLIHELHKAKMTEAGRRKR